MGFFKKLQFWKRRKNCVSPTTVDVGVSTEELEKCDMATMTDNEIVGMKRMQTKHHYWKMHNGANPFHSEDGKRIT